MKCNNYSIALLTSLFCFTLPLQADETPAPDTKSQDSQDDDQKGYTPEEDCASPAERNEDLIKIPLEKAPPSPAKAATLKKASDSEAQKKKRTENLRVEVAVSDTDLPKEVPPPEKSRQVIIRNTKGLVLLGQMSDVRRSGWSDVDGVEIIDLTIPGDAENLKKRLLPLFLHKDLTQESIIQIRREILRYYKHQDHPLVLVQVPEQDVTNGVLQIVVAESRVGKIVTKGNRWTKSKTLKRAIQLKPGDEIDEEELLADLDFINRNPFRRTEIVYAPGDLPGTTDIELVTEDRRPLRLYTGVENTGLEDIGVNRWLAGFNWGNLFGLDQQLSYQYTASFNIHQFQAHMLHYTVPFPWHDFLVIYGGYSMVHANIFALDQNTRSHGFGTQISARYEMPFRPSPHYTHQFSLGGDFKRTNNNLEFLDDPLAEFFGHVVNLTQIVAGYNGTYEDDWAKTTFLIEGFWSPGQWIADQTFADYQTLRVGSNPHYAYARASFANITRLPQEFSFSLLCKWQISDRNLLPSEQLGIGGYNTVRGYEERQLNEDDGFILTGELRTPVIKLFNRIGKHKISDALQFLVFMDYGYGTEHELLVGEPKFQYLWSVGPGLRYDIAPYLSARLDWGIKLHRDGFGGGDSRIHFGIIASY